MKSETPRPRSPARSGRDDSDASLRCSAKGLRPRSPVVAAAHSEPEHPNNTFAAAQPIPEPRPVVPEPKPGSEPPTAPKALPPVLGAAPSVGGPLALDEVLFSVERNYPLLRAIEQERGIAGGRLVTSMRAFDLNLNAGADGQGTTYDNFRSTLGVSQGLPVGGIGAFAGYRNGYGDFPTYNLGQKTADGGEFRAGLTIPLMRDRAIDRPRANIQQARLDYSIVMFKDLNMTTHRLRAHAAPCLRTRPRTTPYVSTVVGWCSSTAGRLRGESVPGLGTRPWTLLTRWDRFGRSAWPSLSGPW